jgi:hypothetical protein
MRQALFSFAAVVAALAVPGIARADEAGDRSAAIRLCRAEVSTQAGLEADNVRFDQVRVRPRLVRVDLDVWRNGQLQNVRCDVTRRNGEVEIASITPALQSVAAAR